MVIGFTAKLAPLATLPIATPPEGTVNQLMLLPDEIAVNWEVPPAQTVAGVAIADVGAARGATVTVTAVLVDEVQPDAAFQESKTWPFPLLTPCVCVVLVPLE